MFCNWQWWHNAYTTQHQSGVFESLTNVYQYLKHFVSLIPSLQRHGISKRVGSFIFNHNILLWTWLYQRRNCRASESTNHEVQNGKVLQWKGCMFYFLLTLFLRKNLFCKLDSVWLTSWVYLCVHSTQHKAFLTFTLWLTDSLLWKFQWKPWCCKFAIYFSIIPVWKG